MPHRTATAELPEATPEAILAARERAALTQEQAAFLVHLRDKARWSEYERGARAIDSARWHLFLVLTHQLKA